MLMNQMLLPQDLFLSKPLREEDVAVLRACATAYAEARVVEAAAEAAAASAAARARMAREVLGLPLLVAAQVRGARASPSPPRPPHGKEPGSGRSEVEE